MKICYKLLYIIQGVENSFGKVTSWPQLISEFLVAHARLQYVASDWPTPQVFLFSVNEYYYFVEAYVT